MRERIFRKGMRVNNKGRFGVVDFIHSDGMISVQFGNKFELMFPEQLA